MNVKAKSDAKRRLQRISGQVHGIERMLDEDRYCVDILTQVSALRAALDQLGVVLLSSHLETCVLGETHEETDAACVHPHQEERLEEIKKTLNRFLR